MDRDRNSASPPLQELSFYLLLLAFFILLTNLSVAHTAKLKSVTESLNSTFAATGRPTSTPDTLATLAGDSPGVADAFRDLGTLIRTDIALAAVDVKSPGGPFEARFPLDDVFVPAGAEIRPDRLSLIREVAERLRSAPPGVRYDVEVSVAGGWVAPQQLAEGEPLAVGRAGRLAEALAGAGLAGGRVAGGLMQREGDFVRLLVHARPAGESDAPLRAPEGRAR
jgi:hypothetical protein